MLWRTHISTRTDTLFPYTTLFRSVNYELINRKIAQEILEKDNSESDTELINISEDGKSISGAILKIENLKYFSIKFYKALKKLNRLVRSEEHTSELQSLLRISYAVFCMNKKIIQI